MSAQKINGIVVAVTGGDAISTNRLSGKSNTGTYFISSKKDWPQFNNFFESGSPTIYKLDLRRVRAYKHSFKEFFFKKKDLYPDKMKNFENICDSLLMYKANPEIKFELRVNDTRIFLKFVDNSNEIEYALRGIIYSNLTNIVFIKNKNENLFYPEINFESKNENQDSKEEFYDEFD